MKFIKVLVLASIAFTHMVQADIVICRTISCEAIQPNSGTMAQSFCDTEKVFKLQFNDLKKGELSYFEGDFSQEVKIYFDSTGGLNFGLKDQSARGILYTDHEDKRTSRIMISGLWDTISVADFKLKCERLPSL